MTKRRERMWSFAKLTKVALPSIESVADPLEREELEREYLGMQDILDELKEIADDRKEFERLNHYVGRLELMILALLSTNDNSDHALDVLMSKREPEQHEHDHEPGACVYCNAISTAAKFLDEAKREALIL